MRMADIIEHKKQGLALTKEEIDFFVKEYTNGDIPDYQASALAMAIYFNKMTNGVEGSSPVSSIGESLFLTKDELIQAVSQN